MSITIDVSGNTYSIRDIKEKDVDDRYVNLLSQLSHVDTVCINKDNTKNFLDTLNSNHKIFVIEDLNTKHIIGSGTVLIEQKLFHNYGKVGHIEDVIIDYGYKKHGLGKLLVEYLSDYCIVKHNCYKCILNCQRTETLFYRKCGYNYLDAMCLYNNINTMHRS